MGTCLATEGVPMGRLFCTLHGGLFARSDQANHLVLQGCKSGRRSLVAINELHSAVCPEPKTLLMDHHCDT